MPRLALLAEAVHHSQPYSRFHNARPPERSENAKTSRIKARTVPIFRRAHGTVCVCLGSEGLGAGDACYRPIEVLAV